MYSNIPIDEGVEAFKEELEKRDDKTVPTEFYIKLLKLVLESNIFEFNRWELQWGLGWHQRMQTSSWPS